MRITRCVCALVDNFVVLSQTARHNAMMLDHAEGLFWRAWGLRFVQTSREIMPCVGAPADSLPSDRRNLTQERLRMLAPERQQQHRVRRAFP